MSLRWLGCGAVVDRHYSVGVISHQSVERDAQNAGRRTTKCAPRSRWAQAASLTSIFFGSGLAGFGIVIFRTPFDMVA
jgi:hypothetical protein